MPRNASGVYTLPAGNPVISGTTIESTWANTTMSDVGNEITNSIDKGGRTSPTANLPMNNFRHYGASAATAGGQYLVFGQAGAVLLDLQVTTIGGAPSFPVSPTVPTAAPGTTGQEVASLDFVGIAVNNAIAVAPIVAQSIAALAILNYLGA